MTPVYEQQVFLRDYGLVNLLVSLHQNLSATGHWSSCLCLRHDCCIMQNDFCKTGAALILLSDLHTCLLGDEVLSADRRPKTGEALIFQGSEARSISNSAKVKSADYIASSLNAKSWPAATLPEIAVIGRSNVGKSSLINMLTGRKDLALVSKSPGCHCHIASCLPEGCSLTPVYSTMHINAADCHDNPSSALLGWCCFIMCHTCPFSAQDSHSGSRAGKTRTINHFLINKAWYLVDLPGYG